MHILFANGVQVPIELTDSPIQSVILNMFRHLQHVSIPSTNWYNPYNVEHSYSDIVKKLVNYGQDLGITINLDYCLNRNQEYFNHLHEIYEKNYNGNQQWLNFHDYIHMCENFQQSQRAPSLILDYKEKSGLVEKKFEYNWIDSSTTETKQGDVYVTWAELGKSPYNYWLNNEPNDLARLCELAKPWLKLKPQLFICFQSSNALHNKKIDQFNAWLDQYKDNWCRHWQIPDWTITHMHSSIVIGKIHNFDQIDNLVKNNVLPTRVEL